MKKGGVFAQAKTPPFMFFGRVRGQCVTTKCTRRFRTSLVARETPLPADRVANRYQGRDAYLEQVAQHLDGLVSSFQLRYPDAKAELDQLRAGSAASKSSALPVPTGGHDG